MPIPKEFDLTGKVALVTGAGRGLCKGIAQVFAESGANVAINALTMKYLGPSAEQIAKSTGRKVIPVAGDMTSTPDIERVVGETMKAFGRIDILVNGTGDSLRGPLVPRPDKPGDKVLSDEELRHILDLNLTQAMKLSRSVAPQMLERRSGKIINISGFAAIKGGVDRVVYSTAKLALMGFTRSQALEWAPYNVQVNCIAPGLFVDPELGETEEQRQMHATRPKIPLGRDGHPRDVGLLALYLGSAASDYMTGQTLYLEGGITL